MRNVFVKTLLDYARKDKNICLITGDLGYGVLTPFWEEFPAQFINAGIAEQNMTGVATGMALEGKTIVTYSIGNFPTLRCLEQIRNDCTYHNANVKIVCVGSGFSYGALGMSHHATEDISIMRALPNIVIASPGDLIEAELITKAILEYNGTCYLRLSKGGEKQIHNKIDDFELGKSIKIKDGKDIVIFSTGSILSEAVSARENLESKGFSVGQYSFPTIKPIDKDAIMNCSEKYSLIVTIEEHNIIGGFGSAVAEVISELQSRPRMIKIGLNDTYSSVVGSQQYLREIYGVDSEHILKIILKELGEIK